MPSNFTAAVCYSRDKLGVNPDEKPIFERSHLRDPYCFANMRQGIVDHLVCITRS